MVLPKRKTLMELEPEEIAKELRYVSTEEELDEWVANHEVNVDELEAMTLEESQDFYFRMRALQAFADREIEILQLLKLLQLQQMNTEEILVALENSNFMKQEINGTTTYARTLEVMNTLQDLISEEKKL